MFYIYNKGIFPFHFLIFFEFYLFCLLIIFSFFYWTLVLFFVFYLAYFIYFFLILTTSFLFFFPQLLSQPPPQNAHEEVKGHHKVQNMQLKINRFNQTQERYRIINGTSV